MRAAVRDPLLRARIAVPQSRPGTVTRWGLAGLVSTQRPAVATVAAPAGYGKSTLMVEWVRRDPRPSAWISLDGTANDPVTLLRLVAIALDALNPLDPTIFDDLASPGVSILGRVVPRVAASMLTAGPFLLLVDDLHEVHDQESRDALTMLLDHLPAGSTAAAASRGDVWLNVARRRVAGELLEIGPRQLAFTVDEAAQLLAAAGVVLPADRVEELHRRTEGWPAGLYLGALALRDMSEADALENVCG